MTRRAATLVLVATTVGCGGAAREAAPLKCAVHVYFCTEDICGAAATRPDVAAARARFQARNDVWSVRFVSKAEALRRMKQRYPGMVAKLPANPFPDSLIVRPVKGADRDRIASSVTAAKGGVERVRFSHDPACAGD